MKPTYSIYTDTLQELTSYSKRIDTATATHDDFVKLQKLEGKIIERYHDRYYRYDEYKILATLAANQHERMREVLLLNARIKELEKELTA